DRSLDTVGAVDLLHPDARATDAGLREERKGEPLATRYAPGGIALEVGAAHRLEVHDGDARGLELALGEDLVHGQSAGGDARPHIGEVQHLEEALHGAVLAPGAMDDGERHLDS